MFIPRASSEALSRYLRSFPVLGITGPRQSGKSTLLRNMLPKYTYVSFDDGRNIAAFEDDPEGFIKQYAQHVIFDEVQFVPKIFNAIKVVVDNDRSNYGRYVMTGSSQFSFLQKVSESLAGRIGLMTQLPFQYSEVPSATRSSSLFQGSYPELVLRNYLDADLWYSSYLDTYLTKDVRTLTQIGDMRDFRRLIQLMAAQTSQLLELSSYAKDLGVSVPTIKRWISVLEASYIVFLLPPFYENFGKRISKSPKIYFYDTGLVSHLCGVSTQQLFDKGPMAGAIFENYVVSEVLKKIKHSASQADLYFFRTQDGAEIDLIVDRRHSCDFIEIKKNSTYNPKMAATLKSYDRNNCRKLLLYTGERGRNQEVEYMPYSDYLLEK